MAPSERTRTRRAGDAAPKARTPADAQEIERRGADAAAGAGDERGLPGREARDAMDGLVGGDVVEDERYHLGVVEALGDGHERGRGAHDLLGVAAVDDEPRHALAEAQRGDAGAERLDVADYLVAGDEGDGRREGVATAPHGDVGRARAGRAHVEAHLAGSGWRHRQIHRLQHLGATLSVSITAR